MIGKCVPQSMAEGAQRCSDRHVDPCRHEGRLRRFCMVQPRLGCQRIFVVGSFPGTGQQARSPRRCWDVLRYIEICWHVPKWLGTTREDCGWHWTILQHFGLLAICSSLMTWLWGCAAGHHHEEELPEVLAGWYSSSLILLVWFRKVFQYIIWLIHTYPISSYHISSIPIAKHLGRTPAHPRWAHNLESNADAAVPTSPT